MAGRQTIVERLASLTDQLGGVVEELSETTYSAIERETLRRVAIAAGIDHTTESTRIIERLGEALQRERDVNRELRRHRDALLRRDWRNGECFDPECRGGWIWVDIDDDGESIRQRCPQCEAASRSDAVDPEEGR